MDRRANCYLNTAYNRNVDDYDDFLDDESHLSFESAENETFVDDFLDDHNSFYSEDDCLAAFDESQIENKSFSLQQLQQYQQCEAPSIFEKSTDRLTSTPKKQLTPLSSVRRPRRRNVIVRRRSISVPGRRENLNNFVECNYTIPNLRRSKSSLSLRPRHEDQRYTIISTPASPNRYQYVRSPSLRSYAGSTLRTPIVTSLPPFHMRHSHRKMDIAVRNQFLRRPYDSNSSFSSTRPLVPRNTAVITPIYNKKPEPFRDSMDEDHSRAFTIAADRSPGSSKANSWMQMKKQTMPKCTRLTSGLVLIFSGILSCILCFRIMSARGKSYEFIVSVISSFITLCLGFGCVWLQKWHWLPNRNYVNGYVILSLFSLLQSATLYVINEYPNMQPEFGDIIKGALYGFASLSMAVVSLGVCLTRCKHLPPPDNRVSHGVQGFTV